MGWGKLVDDLSPSQFDSLVKVLSLPSSTRDFRHFLTSANLQEVFDHPEDFILLKVLRLNFESSRDTPAKEQVHNCLLSRIQEASEEMAGGDVGDEFLFIPSPPQESLLTRLKRPRYLEAETTSELQQRVPTQRLQHAGGRASIPRQTEGIQAPTAAAEESRPSSQPR